MATKPHYFLKDIDMQAILGEAKELEVSRELPMRQWLFAWLLDPNLPGNFQKSIDKWISILIVSNLFSLMFEHVPAVYEPYRQWFDFFDVFSVAVFTIEWACPRFCVNGLMAGNCLHLQRKRNDRKQRTHRPPVGGLQKT